MWKTTVKGLLAHKLRFALTALAVTLGVAFMAGTMVLTDTIGATFDDLFADVNEGVDAVVRAEAAFDTDLGEQRGTIPEALVADVAAAEGVAEAEGFVEGYAQIVAPDGDAIGDPGSGVPTFGFSWPEETPNAFQLVAGEAPAGPEEIVIDRGSAETGDISVGDRVQVLLQGGPREMTVVGVASFGEADSPVGSSVVLFEQETAQQLVGQPGTFDEITVVAEEGVSQEEVADSIREAAPSGVEVLTGEAYIEETSSEIKEGLSFFSTFLLTFALIALFVGSFIIFNTFSIVVAQRTRELALLRALGASRRQVLASVLGEAALVGLLASVVGVVAGIGVAVLLQGLLAALGLDIPASGVVVEPDTLVTGLVVGTLVTLVSAVVPARRAGRLPPVAALQHVAVDRSGTSVVRMLAGGAVTALGAAALFLGLFGDVDSPLPVVGAGAVLVFLGVAALGPVIARPVVRLVGAPVARLKGVTGTLARENAMRNPGRTASTGAALMIGVGLVAFITIFAASAQQSVADSIDRQLQADFVVDSGAFVGGLSPSFAEELGELPGVEEVSGLRFGQAEIGGDVRGFTAVDPADIESLFDVGIGTGTAEAIAEDGIAVHEDVAADEGWELGDTVPVRFAETGVQELTVAAVYERADAAGNFVISLETYEANVAEQFDTIVLVNAADDADAEAVRQELEALVAAQAPQAEVQDRTEFKEAQAAQINQLLNLIYVLLMLAVIIALVGIANTLALSIFERTRELGLLRAVGMTRRQLRSAVRWESVMISLFGTALGLAIGLGFGWALVAALADEGFDTFVVPGGQLALVAALAAVAGVVAAIGPARRAAKLDVLRAIATE